MISQDMGIQELINNWHDLEMYIINVFQKTSDLLRTNTDSVERKQIKHIRHLCFELLRVIDSEF